MNSLLARQVRKHLPTIDPNAEPWRSFLAAVGEAYQELQQDRDHIEHTLEVTSAELNEANEKLRLESERRLQSLDDLYRQTMELQEGMILSFRREGNEFVHTLCRGQLAIRLGWLAERVEGAPLTTLLTGAALEKVLASYRRAWAGESAAFEMEKDGITYLGLLRPRWNQGQVVEVIVSCVEITALKAFERELRAQKERAEKADRAKSEFLAVMSHEIRTPLNAILGFTELLQETTLDEQQRLWLKTVATSGESLRSLIEDILDFSKIEAGMVELNEHAVSPAELLNHISGMFSPRAEQRRLAFVCLADPLLPREVWVDGHRLRQVLINLVGNALKFTESGRISVRALAVPGVTERGRAQVRFEVEDTGIGIGEEQRERMFKPFSQADSSTTRVYGGTGLGLAISKRLVTLLGGEIDFISRPGVGTTFFFTVEVGVVNGDAKPVESAEAPLTIGPVKVLVVEDRPVNRDLMREVLGRLQCETVFAENGRVAVEIARTRRFDLIVMDLQMPEMDGFEATQRIRALPPPFQRGRIVALTASTLAEEHSHCRAVGMDAVLTKPLRLDALKKEIHLAAQESLSPQAN